MKLRCDFNDRTMRLILDQYHRDGVVQLAGLKRVVLDGNAVLLEQRHENRALVDIVDCLHVTLRNWHFVGLGTESPWDATSANGSCAIRVRNSSQVTIDGCTLTNFTGGGIRFRGQVPGLRITGNRICGVGPVIPAGGNGSDAGIGQGGGAATTDGLLISNNDISGHAFGVFVPRGQGIRVTGNWIHDIPGQHGLYAQPGGTMVVANNVLTGCAYCGLKFQTTANSGDVPELISVISNVVTDCGQAAILLSDTSGSSYYRNVQVIGNQCVNAAHGLYLRRLRDCHVAHNRIRGMSSVPILQDDVTGLFADNAIV